ncbi:MAG: diguanylate phosphodiesterase, partial [Caulobacter sp.]|nr:diguanylate phosphodiesterase [Caulobacter sp.]
MAEAFNDKILPAEKVARYAEVAAEIASVLDGEPNLTARMATVAGMLASSFDHYFWTGFYVVDPDKAGELVVGPYQGTLGCLRIAFGRGVCGAAAATGQTQLVAD